jgi:hypothetical protein
MIEDGEIPQIAGTIAEVVDWIRGKQQATEPRPLRRVPSGNRIASR